MIFKPFVPFPYDPKFINVDSSNWSGNFTSKVVPYSSLSPFVPGSNALAAAASALKGGSRKNKKNNMRVYNRMSRIHKHTKRCKINHRRRGSIRGSRRGLSMKRGRSRGRGQSMKRSRSMRGGNVGIRDWITGNSLNNTSYSMPFKYLSPQLSALANPTPFVNTSHKL
jgi:hypothetical protein